MGNNKGIGLFEILMKAVYITKIKNKSFIIYLRIYDIINIIIAIKLQIIQVLNLTYFKSLNNIENIMIKFGS